MLDKHITRLVKGDDGSASFETIDRLEDVIKLAARAGTFDLHEFGVDDERIAALGRDTQLAIAAGIDALRDAGIPLVHALQDHDHRDHSCPTAGHCPSSCATTPG